MRALLDLMRENEAAVKDCSPNRRTMLGYASVNLKILNLERGEE